MATFIPVGKKIKAQVCVNKIRETKTFETKSEAKEWAARRESELRTEGGTAKITFRDLADKWLARYPNRTRIEWERDRLSHLLSGDFGQVRLDKLTAVEVAKFRDERLSMGNQGSTVVRDMGLLSTVCAMAVKEMGLMAKNPFSGVARPEQPEPRNRLATDQEIECLEIASSTMPKMGQVVRMFKLAVQTGLSIGELSTLHYEQVDMAKKIISLPKFKSRPRREVPLSPKAIELLGGGTGKVFDHTAATADTAWRKICRKAGVQDLNFHDSRHMAATWLSTKIDALALAKMLGHTDLRMLIKVYYQADAASLVDKLQ